MAASSEVGNLAVKISMDSTGFQGGISNLNRSMKIVQAEFKAASEKLGGFANSTEQLKLKSESLSQQMQVQRERVSVLKSAFEASAAAKGMDARATQELQIKYLGAETQLSRMEHELSRTTAAIERQGPVLSSFGTRVRESFSRVQASTTELHSHMTSSFEGIKSAAMGVGAALAGGLGIFALTEKAVDAGDAIYMLSKRLGVSSTEAARMGQMLKLTDTDSKPFIGTMLKLDKGLESAGAKGNATTKTLEKYGVSLNDAHGKLLPMTDQVEKLSEAYTKSADAGNEDAFVAEVLGAKGQAMIPLLVDYKDAKEAASKVKIFGIDIEQAHQQEVQMKALKMQFSQFGMVVASSLMPLAQEVLPKIMQGFQDLMAGIKNHKTEIQQAIGNIVDIFKTFGSIILPIIKELFNFIAQHGEIVKVALIGIAAGFASLKIIGTIIKTVSAVSKVFSVLGPIIGGITLPIGIALAVVAALGFAGYELYKHWDQVKAVLMPLWKTISGALTATFGAMKDFLAQTWEAIKGAIVSTWNYIGPTIIGAVKKIEAFWNQVWPQIKQVFVEVWDVMKAILSPILAGLYVAISAALGLIKGVWGDAWNLIKDTFKLVWDGITGVLKIEWDIISGIIKVGLDILTGHWSQAWTDMKSIFGNLWDDIKSLFSNMASDAVNWGGDLIRGLIDGISGMIGGVVDAVKNVASTISGFLHFSVPDEGPLSNYETWMPDFMGGLAKGIEKNKYLVQSAVKGLATDMNLNATISTQKTGASAAVSASPVIVQNMHVRNDQDIQRVAQQLFRLQQGRLHSLGVSG